MTVSVPYASHTPSLAILSILLCCLAGCTNAATRGDVVASSAAGSNTQACTPGAMVAALDADKGRYVIRPGDELSLTFYLDPEFNRDLTVRPDGMISLELVGQVQAAGRTPAQLAAYLDKAYLRELRNPDVTVQLKNSPSWQVYVEGQVAHAGAFPLQPGMTALQAIADAGGVTDTAGANRAVLIRRDACGNPQGIEVNLDAADSGATDNVGDVALLPADVLVVPRSKIANVDLFVKQYIQNLLPVQPYLPVPL